jgi:hypothetical protein
VEEGPQMLSEKEVMRELRGSVLIAVQKGNANIILAEYHRAMSAPARSDRGMAVLLAGHYSLRWLYFAVCTLL